MKIQNIGLPEGECGSMGVTKDDAYNWSVDSQSCVATRYCRYWQTQAPFHVRTRTEDECLLWHKPLDVSGGGWLTFFVGAMGLFFILWLTFRFAYRAYLHKMSLTRVRPFRIIAVGTFWSFVFGGLWTLLPFLLDLFLTFSNLNLWFALFLPSALGTIGATIAAWSSVINNFPNLDAHQKSIAFGWAATGTIAAITCAFLVMKIVRLFGDMDEGRFIIFIPLFLFLCPMAALLGSTHFTRRKLT